MSKATLERSDLASPGAKFSQAAASLTRFKNTREYREQLRAMVRTTTPASATRMEKRRADLLRLEATLELDHLRTGQAPDPFHGVIKFQLPEQS